MNNNIERLMSDIARVASGEETQTMEIAFDNMVKFADSLGGDTEALKEFGDLWFRLVAIQVMLWAAGGHLLGSGAREAQNLITLAAETQGRFIAQQIVQELNLDGKQN